MATRAKKSTPQTITMDILKGTTRSVDFTQMIKRQMEFVHQARRIAGTKPNKIEEAYIDQQKEKLIQLEDIVKSWIWEAFDDDQEITSKTSYWHSIEQNFKITVLVEVV